MSPPLAEANLENTQPLRASRRYYNLVLIEKEEERKKGEKIHINPVQLLLMFPGLQAKAN